MEMQNKMNRTEILHLVEPDLTHEQEYLAMMDEWLQFGGRLNPGALRNNGKPYQKWLSWMQADKNAATCPEGHVPQTLYFLLRPGEARILGALSIRHWLNKDLLVTGGHIAYGIRPSERRKGYATRQLSLGLEQCRAMGLPKVLITCDRDNIGSAKVILNNGGVFENEAIDDDEKIVQRYWITLR